MFDFCSLIGWITVLSEWVNHEDVRVSIPAAKTLANLDFDNDHEYSRSLYLLYPLTRTTKDREVDVVFIHGLLGGVFFTWRQRGRDSNFVGLMGKKNKKGTNLVLRPPETSNPFSFHLLVVIYPYLIGHLQISPDLNILLFSRDSQPTTGTLILIKKCQTSFKFIISW